MFDHYDLFTVDPNTGDVRAKSGLFSHTETKYKVSIIRHLVAPNKALFFFNQKLHFFSHSSQKHVFCVPIISAS